MARSSMSPSAPCRTPLPYPSSQRHEIVYLPSVSALAIQRQVLESRPPAPKRLIVLADPGLRSQRSPAHSSGLGPRQGDRHEGRRRGRPGLRAPPGFPAGGGGDRRPGAAVRGSRRPGLRCQPRRGPERPAERLPHRALRHPRGHRRRASGALGAGALHGGPRGPAAGGFPPPARHLQPASQRRSRGAFRLPYGAGQGGAGRGSARPHPGLSLRRSAPGRWRAYGRWRTRRRRH